MNDASSKDLEDIQKLNDDYNQYSDIYDIYFVPIVLNDVTDGQLSSNDFGKFPLRVYLPKKKEGNKKPSHVYLMLNGMGEVDPMIYDGLVAALLSEKPHNAAILLPIPDHFVRRVDFPSSNEDPYKVGGKDKHKKDWMITHDIIDRLVMEPSGLIAGFKQFLHDIKTLMTQLTNLPTGRGTPLQRFSSENLDKDMKVSLLGYSLGGLTVIAAMLKYCTDWDENDKSPDMITMRKRFSTFILIESGASLVATKAGFLFKRDGDDIRSMLQNSSGPEEIEVKRLFTPGMDFDRRREKVWDEMVEKVKSGEIEWKKIINDHAFLNKMARSRYDGAILWESIIDDLFKNIRTFALTPKEKTIFEMVCLGEHQRQFQRYLSQNVNRLMILLGGVDEVFNPVIYYSFAPAKTGLALFQIPELGHWLKFRDNKKWDQWRPFISALIEDFRLLGPQT